MWEKVRDKLYRQWCFHLLSLLLVPDSCPQLELLRGRDGRDGRDGPKGEKGDIGVIGLPVPQGERGGWGRRE